MSNRDIEKLMKQAAKKAKSQSTKGRLSADSGAYNIQKGMGGNWDNAKAGTSSTKKAKNPYANIIMDSLYRRTGRSGRN